MLAASAWRATPFISCVHMYTKIAIKNLARKGGSAFVQAISLLHVNIPWHTAGVTQLQQWINGHGSVQGVVSASLRVAAHTDPSKYPICYCVYSLLRRYL